MSARRKILRYTGTSLDGTGAAGIAERVRAAPGDAFVIDLSAVGTIDPAALEILSALAAEHRREGAGIFLRASGEAARALTGAGIRLDEAQKKPARAPREPRPEPEPAPDPRPEIRKEERRAATGVPHPRSVPIPKVEELGATMTDFGTIIAAVLSRKWLLLAIAVIAAGAGLAAGMLFGTATFETEAVLLYKPSDNELSDEYEVLQNIDAATTFVYRQGSRKEQSSSANVQIKTLLNTVKIPANLEAVRAKLNLQVPLNAVGSAIQVRVQKETELMSVRATWSDAQTAADLANGIVDVFIEANQRINKENVVDMRNRLASRLQDISAQLDKVSGELALFSQRNRIVDLKKESEQYIQELIRLSAVRDEAASRREALKLQIRKLDAALAELRKTIAAEKAEAGKKPSGSEIEAKIAAINAKLEAGRAKKTAMAEYMTQNAEFERVRQLYAEGLATKAELERATAEKDKAFAATQDDPQTAALMREIDTLRAAKSTLPAGSTQSQRLEEELSLKRFEAQLELVATEGAVDAYDESVRRVQASIDGLPSVNKEFARLNTENAGLEAEKKGLERMLAQAETVLAKGSSDFSVISAAPVPAFATSSNKRMLAIAGAFIVLVLGWGTLLLVELLDQRIRSGREAAAALGIRVLASFPRADRARLMPGGPEEPASLEAWRILALKLRRLLSRRGERIMIASVSPGAGKSVVAANLAAAWGRMDERVLVMDSETRAKAGPWPLAALDADERNLPVGLGEFLCFRADRLEEIARPSILPGVDLVGRGTEEAPADQLGSIRFAQLLGAASDKYSLVLVETPAALAKADAAVIGRLCNGIILVLRSRTATPAAVARAVEALGRDRIIGVIMTDVGKAFVRRDA